MRAIRVDRTGGPDVLHCIDDAPVPKPQDGDVLVAVDMAGVNFIDTYYRTGSYHTACPFIPGFEGTGRVVCDTTGTLPDGALVAWCDGFGSYAEYVLVKANRLVAVPQGIEPSTAASMLLQGITAHYLTDSVYHLNEGDTCLITAGAGGVGLLATQFAKAAGATVLSVVSNEKKAQLAYEAGATQVFFYSDNLAEQVRRFNGGHGVDVVYDGVGKTTFHESLEAVRPRGTVCLFGAASGPVDPLDPQLLNIHGSIFLTRPSIGAYTAGEGEFARRAQAVTRALTDKTITVRIGGAYDLADAAQAHADLEARRTVGSLVLDVRK